MPDDKAGQEIANHRYRNKILRFLTVFPAKTSYFRVSVARKVERSIVSKIKFTLLLKFKDFVTPFCEPKKVLEITAEMAEKNYLLLTGGFEININLTKNWVFRNKLGKSKVD